MLLYVYLIHMEGGAQRSSTGHFCSGKLTSWRDLFCRKKTRWTLNCNNKLESSEERKTWPTTKISLRSLRSLRTTLHRFILSDRLVSLLSTSSSVCADETLVTGGRQVQVKRVGSLPTCPTGETCSSSRMVTEFSVASVFLQRRSQQNVNKTTP